MAQVGSAQLQIKPGAVISGTVSGYLVKGDLTSTGATVGDFSFVTEQGSIRLYDQKAPAGGTLDIVYRQPGGSMCLSTDVEGATFTPLEEAGGNPFEYCNYGRACRSYHTFAATRWPCLAALTCRPDMPPRPACVHVYTLTAEPPSYPRLSTHRHTHRPACRPTYLPQW